MSWVVRGFDGSRLFFFWLLGSVFFYVRLWVRGYIEVEIWVLVLAGVFCL